MNTYIIISALLFIFFCLWLMKITEIVVANRYWSRLLFAAALTMIFKFDWGVHFYGLEYEDAYVFNFIARQFANGIFSESFLTDGIICGSIETPISMGTYGGHFITFPVFVSFFHRVFGFEPHYICHINTLIEFLSICILSVFPLKTNKLQLWFLLPIIYCLSPIMNVYANTGFAETFSSFVCLSFILSFVLFDRNKSYENITFCIVCLFMAFLCKRENLCLLVLPLSYLIFLFIKNKNTDRYTIILISLCFLLLFVYFIGIQNVFNIEHIESKDIKMSTFSLDYFIKLFPVFLKSLFSIKYFSVSIWIFFLSICFIRKKFDFMQLILVILFILYLLMYSFHYRGYFFVQYDEISVFDTFRYINNFYYLVPIILFYTIDKISITRKSKYYIDALIALLLIITLLRTTQIRKNESTVEFANRFETAETVCNYLKNESASLMLVADDILLYQIISDNSLSVCDITQFQDNLIHITDKDIYFLLSEEKMNYLNERYNIEITIKFQEPVLEHQGMKLYKVSM